MTKEQKEQIRREMKRRPLTEFITLEASPKHEKNMYICPICGSGTGKDKSGGLLFNPENFRVMCFANGCFGEHGEDTTGALKIIWATMTLRINPTRFLMLEKMVGKHRIIV
jgi:hypothetical protein